MIDDLAPPRARILVGGLVVGALALRLGVMWLVAPSPPIADEAEYLYRSTSLAAGREVIGPEIRPPGSIWYYVAFHRLLDPGMDAVRLANVLAGVVGIALVYLLGSRLFDRRAGVVAAAVAAVYPNLVFYSVSAWNETLYVALTLGGLLLLTRRSPWAVAAAGLLWGLAALTREVGVLLLLVGAGWLASSRSFSRRCSRGRSD
jgi:4-amino-4-deoxy-L-arabinose transferase-like glycosyltransferase